MQQISIMQKFLRILTIIGKFILGLLLAYSIVFSITATIAGFYAYRRGYDIYKKLLQPVQAVQKLKDENPKETLYMASHKKVLNETDTASILLHRFIPLDSIPQILIKAVLAAEDDGFYVHPGFDLVAILNAYEYNKAKNRLKHGASTLTQQMAKNFFVGGEKKFTRKYHELAYTILMETILGKDRILELYLNYAQWGKNIFGCEAASQHYYQKSCSDLSVDQAARLAAVLAKPSRLNPHYTKSILLKKRLRVIGDNLYRRHMVNDSIYIHLSGTDSMIHVIASQKKKNAAKTDSSQVPAPVQEPVKTNRLRF